MGAGAQIFLKKGMDSLDISNLKTLSPLFIGIVLYGVAFLSYTMMLRYSDVSKLYPVIALSYIWVIFMAALFVGEQITWIKTIGSAMIVAGVALIAA